MCLKHFIIKAQNVMSDKSKKPKSIMERTSLKHTHTHPLMGLILIISVLSGPSLSLADISDTHLRKISEMKSPMSSTTALDNLKTYGDTVFCVYSPWR